MDTDFSIHKIKACTISNFLTFFRKHISLLIYYNVMYAVINSFHNNFPWCLKHKILLTNIYLSVIDNWLRVIGRLFD